MNFRDLQYIIAVSEYLNFSEAAKACHVSQPSLSGQIKKIEEHLGQPLFIRDKRQVSVTEFGQSVIKIANNILEQQQAIHSLAKQASSSPNKKLALGGIATIAPYLFPKIIQAANTALPELKLLLHEAKTENLIKALLDDEIDAAIVSLPTDEFVFNVVPLFSERFYLACSKKHPLAKQTSVSLSELQHQDIILLEEGHCFRDQALKLCHQAAAEENTAFHATSLESIRRFIAISDAITLMPEMAVQKDDLAYIEIEDDSFKRDVGIIWKKSSDYQNGIDSFATFLQQLFR